MLLIIVFAKFNFKTNINPTKQKLNIRFYAFMFLALILAAHKPDGNKVKDCCYFLTICYIKYV